MSGASGGWTSRAGAALLLALVFFALSVPDLFDVTRYHGDERFYTDAAIGMVHSGDFLTPRYPDGGLRFEKPLLSYLVLVGSYQLFDVSLFSSRLPFLLAGALLVWCTFRAGVLLLRDEEAAFLAAAIMAACPDVLTLSSRSTPDILLCLFMLLGLTGFALLLRKEEPPRWAHASAWLGTGLAVAVKGGLGFVLVAYAFLWAIVSRDRWARVRRLLHPVFTPLGLLFAVAGFGIYALASDPTGLQRSVDDQVASRVAPLGTMIRHLPTYLRFPLEHLLPWTLFVALCALRDRRAIPEFARRNAFVVRYGLGWLGLLIVIFSAAEMVRSRYLAPGYPLAVIVLAGALTAFAREGPASTLLRRLCVTLLAVIGGAGVLLAVAGARIGPGLAMAGIGVGATALGALLLARRRQSTAALVGLAVTALVAQSLGDTGVRATFSRTPVPAIAERLAAPELAGRRVAQLGKSAHLASKLRMATGGRFRIDGHQRGVSEPDYAAYGIVVSDAPLPEQVTALGFRVEQCGESWGDNWTFQEILAVVLADDPAALLARRSQPYYLAIREEDARP